MNELDADAVPLPLGRIVFEADPRIFERVREHEWPKHWHVSCDWWSRLSLCPLEQLGERRLQAVPHLLDRLHFEAERIGQRLLCQPRADTHTQCAGRELEQREAPRGIEMIEHAGKRARSIEPRRRAQAFDRLGDP